MHTHIRRTARRGVTLIELLIALFLLVMVFSMAIPFFRFQLKSVGQSAGRQEALQNARFAQSTIDRDLRMAGVGVVQFQPMIVQADPMAVTFNADLTTTDSLDPTAVYYDPSIDPAEATSMLVGDAITLPFTSFMYPMVPYQNSMMLPSRAETISYWVALDTLSGRSDEYILYRRVNATAPRIVTKGLIIPVGQPFFGYYRPDSTGVLDSIRTSQLPLLHFAALHGSVADTGGSALTDSIRMVRVMAWGLYKDPVKGDMIRKVETSTKVLNAGMARAMMCGNTPAAPTGASVVGVPSGAPTKVVITWNASADQYGGERDVERYMVFKHILGDFHTGEPIAVVAASSPTYTLEDTDLQSGQWFYGVVAQDCSPQNSLIDAAGSVVVP
jgi:prepilin-type N-terminal cleavage/methylation domain-containing protein